MEEFTDLREGVRKHMQYKVGNGCNISMWHDRWSLLPTLDTIISKRDVYAAGFSNEDSIVDCVKNSSWAWPDQWCIENPILNQYFVPMLNVNAEDKLIWCSSNGNTKVLINIPRNI
ncbi:hypothetical protein Tco_1400445 [Tanacetum coccineum]